MTEKQFNLAKDYNTINDWIERRCIEWQIEALRSDFKNGDNPIGCGKRTSIASKYAIEFLDEIMAAKQRIKKKIIAEIEAI